MAVKNKPKNVTQERVCFVSMYKKKNKACKGNHNSGNLGHLICISSAVQKQREMNDVAYFTISNPTFK